MTDHTYDIREHFDNLVENTLQNYELERTLKRAIAPVISNLSENERATIASELAYRIHDTLTMDPRTPCNSPPSLDRVLNYVHLRFGIADWANRYNAMQREIDELCDAFADGEDLLDDPIPGTDTYDEL
jgi:hypothetical protein